MNKTKFENISYEAHEKFFEKEGDFLTRLKNTNTIEHWRQGLMYDELLPLLNTNDSWLALGDGMGTDTNWLEQHGIDATATDISDYILKQSHQQGYIKKYAVENAEKMTAETNSYDIVLCKEAYHHFPRPYIALYEMIRVSRKAVVLIEAIDIGIQMPIIVALKNILGRFNTNWINKVWKNQFSFEIVGNYVYKISEREMEKVAMGMNLPYLAYKGINSHFNTTLDLNVPKENNSIYTSLKRKIFWRNLLCKLGITPYQMMTCVIFTALPSDEEINKLKVAGFKIVKMPKNPYV
jgi:ubiquinone/menaquinone biosynthesis C-methylase UbiE